MDIGYFTRRFNAGCGRACLSAAARKPVGAPLGAMGVIGNASSRLRALLQKYCVFCGVALRSGLSLRSCGVFVNQMAVQTLDNVPTPKKT
ncbi:hypothetical protein ABQE70_05535 [Xanthomonas campestris pv. campestris]|uniref:hypothetical protein n=1 Tax=Xanthomonas campestris TaxID=339 RepID=UPI0032E3E39F